METLILNYTKSIQSCPTLCDPRDHSPLSSSVHEILQARILEGVTISSSRGSFQPRDQTCISHASCIADRFFTTEPWGTTSKKSQKTGLEMILIAYYYFLKTKQKLHLHQLGLLGSHKSKFRHTNTSHTPMHMDHMAHILTYLNMTSRWGTQCSHCHPCPTHNWNQMLRSVTNICQVTALLTWWRGGGAGSHQKKIYCFL